MSVKFWNYNLVTQDQTVITGTNENALFPLTNLKDPRTTKVFRSTTASTILTFDFITTEEVDSVLLVPHALSGWGFTSTILVQANATNTWGAPAFSTTIQTTDIDQEHNLAIKEFTSQSYRFWRLTFTGVSYVEVSKVFIGKLNDVGNRSVSFGWSFVDNDLSISVANRYAQKFTDIITSQKRIQFSINLLTATHLDLLFEVFDYNKTYIPFFFQVCDCAILNNMKRPAGYFTFDQVPEVSNNHYALYDTTCVISEAK